MAWCCIFATFSSRETLCVILAKRNRKRTIMENLQEIIKTGLIILFFAIPILYNLLTHPLQHKTLFGKIILVLNYSIKHQIIFWIVLIPVVYVRNKFNFNYDNVLTDVWYWSAIIYIFMYLPILAFLNFIRLIIENQLNKK